MKREEFLGQIKSPQWQRRRLEVMQRDDFTCQMCGEKENTLHVHHLRYVNGRNYWEYDDWELITLCEECHSAEHLCKSVYVKDVMDELIRFGLTYIEMVSLLDTVHNQLRSKKNLTSIFGNLISGYTIGDIRRIENWRNTVNS